MITDAKYVAERDRRVALLDKLIEDTRVDALVLTSTAQQAYQIATKYVSGYQLTTRRDFVFMKPGEMPRLIIPTVGQQFHARRLSWLPDENIYCGPMVETVCGWIRESAHITITQVLVMEDIACRRTQSSCSPIIRMSLKI